MDNQVIAKIQFLQRQAASLLLYQSVLQGEVGNAFLDLLQAIRYTDADARGCLQAYGSYFKSLAARNQNWEEYLITQIERADNPFTQQAQHLEFESLPKSLVAAAQHDLQALQSLYECSSAYLSEWVQAVAHLPISPVVWYNEQEKVEIATLQQLENWADAIQDLANYYRQFGTGLFAEYQALRWQAGQFIGIRYPDPVKLSELVSYESQRDALQKNTEFLLSGQVALHVLRKGSHADQRDAKRNRHMVERARMPAVGQLNSTGRRDHADW